MKYIAYGSNMVKEQMAFRCPEAKLIGTGHIERARLEVYLHATVERTRRKTDRVPVAVWEINQRDERSLDRPHYLRHRLHRLLHARVAAHPEGPQGQPWRVPVRRIQCRPEQHRGECRH